VHGEITATNTRATKTSGMFGIRDDETDKIYLQTAACPTVSATTKRIQIKTTYFYRMQSAG
jgi:hypothetical protein